MAQIAKDNQHLNQINAGIKGRIVAHKFEKILVDEVNSINNYNFKNLPINTHNYIGNPAKYLLNYIIKEENFQQIKKIKSYWLGGLATGNKGDLIYDENNNLITKSKSDIIIDFYLRNEIKRIGISVKSCNKKNPTNEQMFFTTARAFCELLRKNNIEVSIVAENALRMFCGDLGYRPIDDKSINIDNRLSDPERWFWEELPKESLNEWKNIFNNFQYKISKILFQKGYKDDPYIPTYLIHQKSKYEDIKNCPIALFSIDEICELSCSYSNFITTEYKIRKGRFKSDPFLHQAPKFGFIQMQRGGQKQHPTQLQFNLKSGYFNLC